MEKDIYLDNSAATRLDESVFEAMKPCYFENFAVATSEFGYSKGLDARETLADARSKIASKLGAEDEEFIFTSGSTEASNLALKGVFKALLKSGSKKNHMIVSRIEDFPVLHSAKSLEIHGFKINYLDVDEYGLVDLDQLKALIDDNTALVSVQHGNQEIGTVQDIAEIGRICKSRDVLFHTDATHTFGRVPLNVKEVDVDIATVSAHTIHGPKGIGGLFVRKNTPISKIMDGGFQEFNLRAGIENIPGAVGFAKAVELADSEESARLSKMRDRLIDLVLEKIPLATLNGHPDQRLPQNANITFHHVEGESITLHLDMYGISVSTGSACFSKSLEASHVISAIGGDHERAHGSIRFTFGRFNSIEEVDRVVETLSDVVSSLRKISPLGKKRSD